MTVKAKGVIKVGLLVLFFLIAVILLVRYGSNLMGLRDRHGRNRGQNYVDPQSPRFF